MNIIKAILALNFIQINKTRITVVLISILMLILTVYISNDIASSLPKSEQITVVLIKWLVVFALLAFILFNLRLIYQKTASEFSFKRRKMSDRQKAHMQEAIKNTQLGKKERIYQKYKRD